MNRFPIRFEGLRRRGVCQHEKQTRVLLGGAPFDSRRVRQFGARDDDGDVIRSAPFVRQRDEALAGRLRIARLDHDALNVFVFHVVDEAVAADQDGVARLHRKESDIRRHLLVHSEGQRDHVLPRTVSRFLGQDLASVDQFLNERVVPGYLENLPCIDDVDPGASRIRDVEAATVGDREAQRRPHPLALRMPSGLCENRLIGVAHRGPELVVIRRWRNRFFAGQEREERPGDRLNSNPARDLPAAVSSHAIGDHQEQPGSRLGQERGPDLDREDAVFVDRSNPPNVRGKSHISVGGSNDRIAHLPGRSLSYGSSRQGHRPPRRRPPLNAIVMYGPLPGLYTNATTSPSVSSSRLNPGICRYVLPPSCDMAVPFRPPNSSIPQRPFPSLRILAGCFERYRSPSRMPMSGGRRKPFLVQVWSRDLLSPPNAISRLTRAFLPSTT